MKQITEMEDKEILALTPEDLDRMVKYKMAEDGIKILEYPKEPEYAEVLSKDDEAYGINGFSYYTRNKEVAEAIGEVLKKHNTGLLTYFYKSNDYSVRYLKTVEDYTTEQIGNVSKELCYKLDTLQIVSGILTANKEKKEAYETAVREYNNNNDQADYIRVEIYSRHNAVIKKQMDMEDKKRIYENYLDLAGGNTDVAMAFLKKAYSIDYQTECFVQDLPVIEIADES